MKPFEQLSWAIDTNSGEGHGLIGRYWPIDSRTLEGQVLRPRLFETRREARAALASMKRDDYKPFPNARVVRVRVTVAEVVPVAPLSAIRLEKREKALILGRMVN